MLASALPAHAELPHAPAYIDDSAYPAAACQRILSPMLEQKPGNLCYLAKPGDSLIIQAESSDFQRTSDYRETRAHLEKLVAASSSHIILRELPEHSAGGHPMLLVIASIETDKPAAGLKRSAKSTLLAEAKIHPGEASGKDAMFILLRDMNAADRLFAGLLEKINPLSIPVVNVDDDLRRSAYGWINQDGLREIGWWVNGRSLNFSRDFIKPDSAEIRNVTWMFNHYELSFFADTHSTDDTMYPYDSPYCHNSNGWSLTNSARMDQVMRRPVYQALESLGYMIHECISPNDNRDPTQGYYPYRIDLARLSSQYGDIHSMPLILIGQHALHPYKTQVLGNYVMFKAMFEVIGEQAANLRQTIVSDHERLLRQKEVVLIWKLGETAETPFVVGDYHYEQSSVTGTRIITWGNRPKTLKLPVTDNDVPDLVVPRPQCFIVPTQRYEVTAWIKTHGIRYTTLERLTEIAMTLYRMDDIKLADGFGPDRVQGNRIPDYEGRLLVSGTPKPFQRLRASSVGSLSIDTVQSLGVLAIDLL